MWESAKTVAPTPHSAIIQLDVDDNFVINSTHLNMIQENKFDGYLRADPHDHIREFLAICNMFKYGKTQSEAVKLMIFPLSLCDEAKFWFNELNEESITSSTEAVTTVRKLCLKMPWAMSDQGVIIQIFYHGLDEPTQAILDVTAGGIFLYKSPNQAFQLLEDKVLFNHDCLNEELLKSRKVSKQKQELMPYPRFTKLIVKYTVSKNDQISKRPLSFQHIIKLDTTLGNLKFENKGTKDPIFGMSIPAIMLNDEIKASVEYSDSTLCQSKRKICTPTKLLEEEKIVLQTRGFDFHVRESEGSGITLKVPDELVFKILNEGAGVTPKVLDKSSNSASRSSSDSEFIVEDISSDEAEDSEKTDC
ncbi:hypothetical protein Tco_0532997 [Tanacetum coccineum]